MAQDEVFIADSCGCGPSDLLRVRRHAGPCRGQLAERAPGNHPRRGLDAVKSEWRLIFTSHNLLKLRRATLI